MPHPFKRNWLWSIGLYIVPNEYSFSTPLPDPALILNSKSMRLKKDHTHTYADPFLLSYGQYLYLFYEVQKTGQKGHIEGIKTADMIKFENLGIIFEPEYHVSYPFVCLINDKPYMIPESEQNNAVSLYRFESFPYEPVLQKQLLSGSYADPCLYKHEGTWYLFATSKSGALEIFYSDDPLFEDFIPHPVNPVTSDLRYFRNGGSPVILGNELYRIAQDCSEEYGRNINILKVTELTKYSYIEELYRTGLLKPTDSWNKLGGHHFSMTVFNDRKIIATDGKQYDYLINKIMSPLFSKL